MAWWLNLAAFFGLIILSVPTWSLNFRKKKLERIRAADQAAGKSDASFRAAVRGILRGRREKAVAEWRRIDEVCLFAGYLLLVGSAGLRLALP